MRLSHTSFSPSWRHPGCQYGGDDGYGHGCEIKVTPREVIFSVLIIGILYSIGFLISSAIQKGVDERNLKYRQAIQIKDSGDELRQASETDIGDAFVEGDFKTIDPVTWEGLKGEHLEIRRDKEKYTMHTRTKTYTVTDGKGRPHTRTRIVTYWTWDLVKRDSKKAKEISFCGNVYPTDTFSYDYIDSGCHIKDTGYHTRDVFHYLPKDFRGAIYCSLKDNKINGKPEVRRGRTIDSLYKEYTTSHAVTIFWWFWGFLIVCAVVLFVIIDNRWLEDRTEQE